MDKLPDTVSKILDELAKRFGSTGAHLWEVLVRQAFDSSLINLLVGGGASLFLIGLSGLLFWVGNQESHNCDTDGFYACGGVAGLLGVFILAVILSCNVLGLLNPEYYALKDILGGLK